MSDFKCPWCFLSYGKTRPPMKICSKDHTMCKQCLKYIKACPQCKEEITDPREDEKLEQLSIETLFRYSSVQCIPKEHLTLSPDPFQFGPCSDVYEGKWKTKKEVAVKLLTVDLSEEMIQNLRTSINLVVGINHRNVLKYYGLAMLGGDQIGIVMEYIHGGSLKKIYERLSKDKEQENHFPLISRLELAEEILCGLEFLHSKNIPHHWLKPENILLNNSLLPKICDYGIQDALREMKEQSEEEVPMLYAAPEIMLNAPINARAVDIYSFSMILFYLLVGDMKPLVELEKMELISLILEGKRPKFPQKHIFEIPIELQTIIERGWSGDPEERPKLSEFREILATQIKKVGAKSKLKRKHSLDFQGGIVEEVSMADRSAEVSGSLVPVPTIGLHWNADFDNTLSLKSRKKMIKELKSNSTFHEVINSSIITAMKVVPRHLFLSQETLKTWFRITELSEEMAINYSYDYRKPMPGTSKSNSSSAEIVGTELSFVKIEPGSRVLFIGAKGGYIQSVTAQIVGLNGLVVTFSSQNNVVTELKERCEKYCPYAQQIMKWVTTEDILNTSNLIELAPFDAILCGGYVSEIPNSYKALLVDGGALIAPYQTRNMQFLTVVTRKGNSFETTLISDWMVRFGELK
ncbi:non-specific serine/threonine protein kinase [Anaeramoeba flamelloides]|uniref:Non-specific serine/threonine protein kinase n=1 Tax=Anaeramoeba flamelloides TaxID=1746091 RepID=A0AAV8A363_9EUKA|nr:non-specific serine/threonine protein kinase [Anaeramoeba flamelloides]KAJ6245665.1 non-specific serine/threonine protein kinase [Anaeramoeba flamelloides]|eukprot:Anaeramoba_flamelloidesa87678_72.p1 GENE.a87678_72~~a87678_72.p1  ORF type:complete len:635 (+),score=141.59 a87678_72:169-2073(+)